MSMNTN